MWIPKNTEDIERAVKEGRLEETSTFDAKRELTSNKELAKDIAAMTVDGGVLLFGIAEDENERPTVLNPIELPGTPERITNVVSTCVAEPPYVRVIPFPLDDDATKGYVAVIVPLSSRAPHMVIVKGDKRYYGRTDRGNRILSEGEVARLYERRDSWSRDAQLLLRDVQEQARMKPEDVDFGLLYAAARPVVPDDDRLDNAFGRESAQIRLEELIDTSKQRVNIVNRHPTDFRRVTTKHVPEGFLLSVGRSYYVRDAAEIIIDLFVGHDGSARLEANGIRYDEGVAVLDEHAIALLTLRFVAYAGVLLDSVHYFGPIDIGIMICNIKDTVSSWRKQNERPGHELPGYPKNTYEFAIRVDAMELYEDSLAVTNRLLNRLIEVTTERSTSASKIMNW